MPTKPTRQRLLVLFVVCLVYFITYLDRVNVSVAAPLLMQEFGISKAQLGAVFSAFMVGYVLFQIPVGMLGDKYGPRIVLTGLVVVWSFFTFAITLAWSFSSLIVLRFLFGIGEAGAFTIATRAFSAWIPKTERGFAQGITHAFAFSSSSSVGAIAMTSGMSSKRSQAAQTLLQRSSIRESEKTFKRGVSKTSVARSVQPCSK